MSKNFKMPSYKPKKSRFGYLTYFDINNNIDGRLDRFYPVWYSFYLQDRLTANGGYLTFKENLESVNSPSDFLKKVSCFFKR